MKVDGGKGYRLHIMWDIISYHHCATEPSVASVGLESYDDKISQKNYFWTHKDRPRTFVHHKDLMASIVIGTGCLNNVTLQFARKQVCL